MKKKTDDFIEILGKAMDEPKTYEDMVQQGADMAYLVTVPQFKTYQRLVLEALAGLVERLGLVEDKDLPSVKGAILQTKMIYKLPQKYIKTAENLVNQKREETEANA